MEDWNKYYMREDGILGSDGVDIVIDDRVDHPSHYTRGGQEVIVTIEQAIQDAPSMSSGYLQGQVLKYLLRMWLKDNPSEDARKARWYLNRLIDELNSTR